MLLKKISAYLGGNKRNKKREIQKNLDRNFPIKGNCMVVVKEKEREAAR